MQNPKHRVLDIDHKNIFARFFWSELKSKNLTTSNVFASKTCLYTMQWRHLV